MLYACMPWLSDAGIKVPIALRSLLLQLSSAQNERLDLEVLMLTLQLLRHLKHPTVNLAQLVPGGDASIQFMVPEQVHLVSCEHRIDSSAQFMTAVGPQPAPGTAVRPSGTRLSTDRGADSYLLLERIISDDRLQPWWLALQSKRAIDEQFRVSPLPQVTAEMVKQELAKVNDIFKDTPSWQDSYTMVYVCDYASPESPILLERSVVVHAGISEQFYGSYLAEVRKLARYH